MQYDSGPVLNVIKGKIYATNIYKEKTSYLSLSSFMVGGWSRVTNIMQFISAVHCYCVAANNSSSLQFYVTFNLYIVLHEFNI